MAKKKPKPKQPNRREAKRKRKRDSRWAAKLLASLDKEINERLRDKQQGSTR